MIINYLRIVLIFLVLVVSNYSHTQAQETAADTNSSISNHSLDLANLLELQKQDSLKRIELENKLLGLQLNDQKENQKLYDELAMLKSRDSIAFNRRKQKVDSLRLLNAGIPVIPFTDTLFTVYTNIGSYTAKDRAAAIASRIINLANLPNYVADSLTLYSDENAYIIMYQDQMVFSVTDNDALWMNTNTDLLANEYLKRVQDEIKIYREKNSLKKILTGLGLAVVIIFIVYILLNIISRAVRYIKKKVVEKKDTIIKGIYIKDYELVSSKRQLKLIWLIVDAIKWVLILITVYLALPLLLNLFPSTEGYAPLLIQHFVRPLKEIGVAVIHYFPNFITVIIIGVIFHYLLKLLHFFANEVENGALAINGFYKEWAKPTYQILKVLLLAFMMIVIFPYLPGSESPIFKGVSVFIGVLFTFSSAGALGNIVAGLVLTYMRPFVVGDRVKIGEVSGDIIEKSLLVTRIRTVKNEVISIPNAQVLNSHSINYSIDDLGHGLIIHTNITLAYEIPWTKVHELAKKAALQVELIEKTPEPFILQSSLEDFYVNYQVNAYTKHPNAQAFIYSELHKHLLDTFHEEGIELMSPHYRAWRDGSQLDIPPKSE